MTWKRWSKPSSPFSGRTAFRPDGNAMSDPESTAWLSRSLPKGNEAVRSCRRIPAQAIQADGSFLHQAGVETSTSFEPRWPPCMRQAAPFKMNGLSKRGGTLLTVCSLYQNEATTFCFLPYSGEKAIRRLPLWALYALNLSAPARLFWILPV